MTPELPISLNVIRAVPSNWGLVKKITAFDGAADDYFGYNVSISGDTVVVGAVEDDDNGSAYVFESKGKAMPWIWLPLFND